MLENPAPDWAAGREEYDRKFSSGIFSIVTLPGQLVPLHALSPGAQSFQGVLFPHRPNNLGVRVLAFDGADTARKAGFGELTEVCAMLSQCRIGTEARSRVEAGGFALDWAHANTKITAARKIATGLKE